MPRYVYVYVLSSVLAEFELGLVFRFAYCYYLAFVSTM